jgi:hypothetical protein
MSLPPGSYLAKSRNGVAPKEIVVTNQTTSPPASAPAPIKSTIPVIPNQVAPGAIMKDWLEYVTDAYQRGVLYLDVLRRRGNEEEEIASRPMATVLHFDHEVRAS